MHRGLRRLTCYQRVINVRELSTGLPSLGIADASAFFARTGTALSWHDLRIIVSLVVQGEVLKLD